MNKDFTHGRIGQGTAVHIFFQKALMCGSGKSSHMHNFRNPRQQPTDAPVTCKKCIAFMEAYEKSRK